MKETKTALHLNLIRKWFEMIYEGEKKEEYREITTYWCARLLLFGGKHGTPKFWQSHLDCIEKDKKFYLTEKGINQLKIGIRLMLVTYKPYPYIIFSNGMTPPIQRFNISILCLGIGIGKMEWGAEPGKQYFVFELGLKQTIWLHEENGASPPL